MSGLNIMKFSMSKELVDSLHEGKNPSASDLDSAISASDEGDSDV